MNIPTVKIKHKRRGFIIINESDFDDTKHELYSEETEQVKKPVPKRRRSKPKVKQEEAAE